jgi:hypothetical protein
LIKVRFLQWEYKAGEAMFFSGKSKLSQVRNMVLLLAICSLIFAVPYPLPFGEANPAYAQPASEQPANSKISFKGGPGDSLKTAVVISGAPNSMAGIAAEYYYLKQHLGRQNVDWLLRRQSVVQQDGKVYDRLELDLKGGSRKTVFFDISEFFGKL